MKDSVEKIAIVTGSKGFVGKHLLTHLESIDYKIIWFDKPDYDITNYEQVRNKLDLERPTHIFHLAAQAYVPESFMNPQRVFEVNTIGSLNILEAVRQLGLGTKILLAGTSEEYGDGEVDEESKLQPRSPYAISKLAMDHLGRLYADSYNMHVVVTRAFNHTGPGRGEMYAESSFAKQIAEIEKGKRAALTHGNISSIRNYTDVRDMVKAYEKAIGLPSDVYNICSGRNISIAEVLNILRSMTSPFVMAESQALFRPSDFSFKVPNCNKFKKLSDGWEPEIPLEKTLQDLLNYWRDRV